MCAHTARAHTERPSARGFFEDSPCSACAEDTVGIVQPAARAAGRATRSVDSMRRRCSAAPQLAVQSSFRRDHLVENAFNADRQTCVSDEFPRNKQAKPSGKQEAGEEKNG